MNTIRKVSNQSQPVSGRELSADDDGDNEDNNQVSQSQSDKGNQSLIHIKMEIYFSIRK